MDKLTGAQIRNLKSQRKVSMITVYDAAFARMAQAAGIDTLLVGDSAANVALGLESTRQIGMTEMLIFVGAVRRGAPDSHVVADMPYGSDDDPHFAVQNAKAFVAAGADSVKVEGYKPDSIHSIRECGIDVIGHLGLLPQTATSFKQVGRDPEEAERIVQQSMSLDRLGICGMVLEHVPDMLGARIQAAVSFPVIGIGAGPHVDGQVLVLHDALGMHPFKVPPFASKFTNLYEVGVDALVRYRELVSSGRAPGNHFP